MSCTEVQQTSMFLPGVEQNPKPSTYLELIEAARASGTEYWQIWHLLAFQPEAARNLVRFSQIVMHDPAPISPGLRELIAAYTSSPNQCEFCMKAHTAVAAHIYQDDGLVASVLRNPETSPLSEKEKLLLRFVRKVTFASANINAADTESLRAIIGEFAVSGCSLTYTCSSRAGISGGGWSLQREPEFSRAGSIFLHASPGWMVNLLS